MMHRQLFRWGVKSVGGLAANLLLLTLWVDVVGWAAWWAVGINWILIAIVGYVVTDQWVFLGADSPKAVLGHVRQFIGMQTVMTSGKAINYLIYVVLLPVVDYRIAWVIGAVVTFVGTYLGNRYLWTSDSPTLRAGS